MTTQELKQSCCRFVIKSKYWNFYTWICLKAFLFWLAFWLVFIKAVAFRFSWSSWHYKIRIEFSMYIILILVLIGFLLNILCKRGVVRLADVNGFCLDLWFGLILVWMWLIRALLKLMRQYQSNSNTWM